jgi:prepilin-type processing-associated H-X9-DG protein
MNLRLSKKRNQGMDILDLLVIIAMVAILAIMFVLIEIRQRYRVDPFICVNNLKQVNLSLRIWEGDHNNKYPMSVSMLKGGGMELIATGNVADCLQVMSNELATPKILICPYDRSRFPATNFQNDFNNSHISYFINPDADESYPQEIMSGDANLAIDGVPVKSGLVVFPSNTQVSWTAARHGRIGNIGYADGSVSEVSTIGLQSALALATNGTPNMINRLAIP